MSVRLLVDGTGVVHRCFWGSASNVVDRFAVAVQRALPTSGADILVCWDGRGSWRRELYGRYKAGRPAKPQALIAALEECRRCFRGYVADGWEADDLLATFARRAAFHANMDEVSASINGNKNDAMTLILSDDKDLLSLVGWRCVVVTSSGAVMDTAAVQKKWGVPPDRMQHLLSWMGDRVDGLPGIPGYGPKKAAAKALAGEVGNRLTYELAELADVPVSMMRELTIRKEVAPVR